MMGALAALILGTAPAMAKEFRGKRNTRVNPVNAAVFEVVAKSSSGGADYWCGASDYAVRALGASWQARLYVARGWGPSPATGRRSAIFFTLDPQAAGIAPAKQSLSINSFKVGDNMSVQQANTYCHLPPTRF